MFSISNNEINALPEQVFEGMLLEHRHEDGTWEQAELQYGISDGKKNPLIGFIQLKNGSAYIVSVAGKLLQRETLRVVVSKTSNN